LVSGERISGDATIVIYQFSVHNALRTFLSGRATVALDAAALTRAPRASAAP